MIPASITALSALSAGSGGEAVEPWALPSSKSGDADDSVSDNDDSSVDDSNDDDDDDNGGSIVLSEAGVSLVFSKIMFQRNRAFQSQLVNNLQLLDRYYDRKNKKSQ